MDHAGHQLVKRRVFEICKVHYKHVIIDKKKVLKSKVMITKWVESSGLVWTLLYKQIHVTLSFYILPILG